MNVTSCLIPRTRTARLIPSTGREQCRYSIVLKGKYTCKQNQTNLTSNKTQGGWMEGIVGVKKDKKPPLNQGSEIQVCKKI